MSPRRPLVTTSFRIDPELLAKAQAKADARGDVLADIYRKAVERYLRSAK